MARAGIAIDSWKLPYFERELSANGYVYEIGVGVTKDTKMLYVDTDDMGPLEKVVRAANDKCREIRRREGAN